MLAKKLEMMNKEELGRLFPIILTQYNPLWPERYLSEKNVIEKAIGPTNIARIRHYGSTSVPGIWAKPTIDILLEVHDNIDTDILIEKFRGIGYIYSPQKDNPPPSMMFMKGYTLNGYKGQAYHVHVRYRGDWDEIYFRDYLILHPEVAREYQTLKLKLQKKYKNDREAYTLGKTEFIQKVTETARKELSKIDASKI
jgi:GrpB-like predicted nucleotidyltransferase (UPF0157 family)